MYVALHSQFLQGSIAVFLIHYLVCQKVPGANKNNLKLVLVKSLTGGLPPIFYVFGLLM